MPLSLNLSRSSRVQLFSQLIHSVTDKGLAIRKEVTREKNGGKKASALAHADEALT